MARKGGHVSGALDTFVRFQSNLIAGAHAHECRSREYLPACTAASGGRCERQSRLRRRSNSIYDVIGGHRPSHV